MKQYTASKLFWALGGMVVMLVFMAGIASAPALAATNGIYIATASPHYKHPATGKIEDAGGEGSSVLGQSMTESATYKKALVEVDPAGNTFITVRLQLMDNIQNPQFQVDGVSVSTSLMQEDYTNNTADFRMQVNSENSVIRCNMYVIPMGREVIFYITVSNLQSGSEDFITSIAAGETNPPSVQAQSVPEPQNSVSAQPSMQAQSPEQASGSVQTQSPAASSPASAQTGSQTSKEAVQPEAAQTESESLGTDNAELSAAETDEAVSVEENSKKEEDTASGLQEFDQDGNRVDGSKKADEKKAGSGNAAVWWIFGGILVAAAAGGCIWYFCFFKKKGKEKDT